jgi:o-succinylbenzoate synthase
MRITEASLEPLRLELLRPLKTARATYTARAGFVVRLKDEEGREGLGEAMPLEEFGTESPGDCEQALRHLLSLLPTSPLSLGEGRGEGAGLSGLVRCLEGLPSRGPAANHALEQALLDLLARRRGVPLSHLLSGEAREEVEVNALLGAETPEALAEEARRAVAEGYRTLKLKVAGRPLEEDEARLAAVRRAAGPESRLRVDANGGWREGEAGLALDRLGRHSLELCEQPVAAEAYEALGRLQSRAPCPLAADESLALPEAVPVLLESTPRVGLLVLKPMVLGGLSRALSLARQARERGMDAYVTSSLDGVVARAGAAHLAAALPSGRYASGLAVGHLFKDEPMTHPFRPERGRIRIPRVPGLGVS